MFGKNGRQRSSDIWIVESDKDKKYNKNHEQKNAKIICDSDFKTPWSKLPSEVLQFGPLPSGKDLSNLVIVKVATSQSVMTQLRSSAELSYFSVCLVVESTGPKEQVCTVYLEGEATADFLGRKGEVKEQAVTKVRRMLQQTRPVLGLSQDMVDVKAALDREGMKAKALLLQRTGDPPVGRGNRGRVMLVKMGWRAGSGLGQGGRWRLEPVQTFCRSSEEVRSRAGLGYLTTGHKARLRVQEVEVLVMQHLQQDTIQDLAFGPGLDEQDKKVIEAAAQHHLMATGLVRVGKGKEYMVLSSKVRLKHVAVQLGREGTGTQLYVRRSKYNLTSIPTLGSLEPDLQFQHLRKEKKFPVHLLTSSRKKKKKGMKAMNAMNEGKEEMTDRVVDGRQYKRASYVYGRRDEPANRTKVEKKLQNWKKETATNKIVLQNESVPKEKSKGIKTKTNNKEYVKKNNVVSVVIKEKIKSKKKLCKPEKESSANHKVIQNKSVPKKEMKISGMEKLDNNFKSVVIEEKIELKEKQSKSEKNPAKNQNVVHNNIVPKADGKDLKITTSAKTRENDNNLESVVIKLSRQVELIRIAELSSRNTTFEKAMFFSKR
jgi:hypothetical protein